MDDPVDDVFAKRRICLFCRARKAGDLCAISGFRRWQCAGENLDWRSFAGLIFTRRARVTFVRYNEKTKESYLVAAAVDGTAQRIC